MSQRAGESAPFTLTGDVLDESSQMVVQPERDAVSWLREQLSGHDQRIGDLTRLWCREEKWWKEDLEALMAAKNALHLMSYVGQDGRFWWELPEEMAQGATRGPGNEPVGAGGVLGASTGR